jgi:tRNA-modifying protein YgfZ
MIGIDDKSLSLIEFYESIGGELERKNGSIYLKKMTSIEEEHGILYSGVGLRDISSSGVIELKGKDVLDFLHRISTNATKDLQKESLTETIFTSEKGRIIDLTTLINFDDYKLLVCSKANKDKVLWWIQKYTITDDVAASDVTGKYSFLEIIGPHADSFMTMICGNIANDIQPETFKVINAEGIIFFLARVKHDGKTKFWVFADPVNGKLLIKYMMENKGAFDFGIVGEDAYKSYRIERGIPASPNELNDQFNPHEAKITDAVSFTKGCFIGQEVIARLDTYDKIQKKLMGISFVENVDLDEQYLLFDAEGKDAGIVTSIVNSIKCNKIIGLGYVRKLYAEEGVELTAKSSSGQTAKILVKNLPFKK